LSCFFDNASDRPQADLDPMQASQARLKVVLQKNLSSSK